LHLIVLEDRLAPAMFTVAATANADPAPLPPPSSFGGTIAVQSLRQAVIDANADPTAGTDTIQLGSGTYSLTRTNGAAGQENAAQTGDLDITSTTHALMIVGQGSSGPNTTIIDGSALQDRLFQVVNAGIMVQFRDLVLQGGVAHDNGTTGVLPGSTDACGGALLNQGGSVTLLNVVVQNNQAQGSNGAPGTTSNIDGGAGRQALGGGVFGNSGTLSFQNATLWGNLAQGGAGGAGSVQGRGGTGGAGGNGGLARGGAVYAAGGILNVQGCSLKSNMAQGGAGGNGHSGVPISGFSLSGGTGGNGASGQGGGAYLGGVTLVGAGTAVTMNSALGGAGGSGGDQVSFGLSHGINGTGGNGGAAQGGGLLAVNGTGTLTNFRCDTNTARGGNGNHAGLNGDGGPVNGGQGGSAQGGGVYEAGATLHLPGATFSTNTAQGSNGGTAGGYNSKGGNGGGGQGGGLFAGGGIVDLSDATLSSGLAEGGLSAFGDSNPGVDGYGTGGAVVCAGATLTLFRCTIANNTARAAIPDPLFSNFDGAAYGGGLYVSAGSVTLTDTTLAANVSLYTDSVAPLRTEGGGLYAAGGTIDLRNSTVADNTAGSAGGGVVCGSAATVKTLSVLFGGNTAGVSAAPSDFTGNVTASASLFQTAPTGTITADPRSQRPNLLNVDPLLGTLGEHGGPTPTLYLQNGSPALGTGDNPLALTTDQRGFAPRTTAQGNTDIGAFQASLSNGQIGTPYSQQFPTTAPAGALRYAVTAGALPPGLSLSPGGLLSGTPTAGGVFNFSLTTTDPSNATDTLPCTLTVWNPQPIGWQPSRDVTISGNSLSVAVAGNWGRGAASAQSLTGDGSVVFTATEANTFRALGLTHNAPNHNYAGMDFCLELTAAGQVVVYEGGVYRGGIGHYGTGDQFRIAVEGGRVNYYQKAAGSATWSLLRSVIAGITYPLRVDTSFCTAGATLDKVGLIGY
jgi:hypothetical protein